MSYFTSVSKPKGQSPRVERFWGLTGIAIMATALMLFFVVPASPVFAAGGISGQVWNDMNASTTVNSGEPGIRGVTVQLRAAGTDGIFGTGDDVLYTDQVTDNSGNYSFTALPDGGKYRISIDFLSLPEGFDLTTANEPQVITLGTNDNRTNVNFGYQFGGKSSIGNYVWNDVNANGDWVDEGTEFAAGIQNVTLSLYLDQDGDGIFDPSLGKDLLLLTTSTDGTGKYSFPVSANGNEFFVLVDDSNFQSGGALENYLFTNGEGTVYDSDNPMFVPLPQLTVTYVIADFGYVQASTLGGTVYDDLSGNGGFNAGELPLANVLITLSNGMTTTTDANGVYTFTNLLPGNYTIVETDPTGYNSTGDTQGSLTDNSISVTLTQGTSSLNNNFFDARPTIIGGGVYDDLDGDGVQDSGEPALVGVTVTLSNGAVTTTDASGLYTFTVMPGTYTVTETNPSGYTSTGAEAGSGTGTNSSVTNADTISVTTTSGSTSLNNDFLDQDPVTITGTVWDDKNAISGVDGADSGIANVTLTLSGTDGLGNPVNVTTTTDANGVYTFTNVPAGSYIIAETNPAGYTSTGDVVGANNDQIPVTVTSGTNVTGRDFWDTLPVTIGGAVYDDLDGDGVQDSGEPALVGVTVTLSTGAVTTTDASGLYTFTVLAGSYTITETNPANYTSTGAEAGTNGSSVTNADTIRTGTLTSGQSSLNNDFLDQDPVTITGTVFEDPAGNGTGATGIPNVTLTLSGTDGLGNPINVTTTTDASGNYTFTNVPAGSYTIVETNPTNYLSTDDVQGSPTDDTIALTVTSGTNVVDQDFWDQPPLATIGDFVWYDTDGDGIQDAGEPGIANVGITLTLPGGSQVTTTTDANGIYTFTNLPQGTYVVTVNTGTLPADFALTVGPDSSVNPLSVTVTQAQTVDTADFGFDIPTSYLLSKDLSTPNPARTGEVIRYTIKVTNTGKSVLTALPMTDTFNHLFLQFVSASSTPDFNLDGTVRWNDLTTAAGIGDLAPNATATVTVTFLALRDTYLSPGGVTTNTVTINGGLADPDGPGPLGNLEPLTQATDTAPVRIDGPTAALLSDSNVDLVGKAVSINWTTSDESAIVGFNVQRWDSLGNMVVVNSVVMPAQNPGQPVGAFYTMLDQKIDQQMLEQGYTYVLDVLKTDGSSTLLDLGQPTTTYTIFLPLVIR